MPRLDPRLPLLTDAAASLSALCEHLLSEAQRQGQLSAKEVQVLADGYMEAIFKIDQALHLHQRRKELDP